MGIIGLLFLLFTLPLQQAPLKGVIWSMPASRKQAKVDLLRMHLAGVEAIRTGVITDEQILRWTDSLGFKVFQDLPIYGVAGERLEDTLAFAQRVLGQMLERAHRHPSARYFGLAVYSNTRSAKGYTYFKALTEYVHEQGPEGSQTYYVTFFTAPEAVASAVDMVLLERLDSPAPLADWKQFYVTHGEVASGISVGTYVDEFQRRGYRLPHTAEYQARYLERILKALLVQEREIPPSVLWVYRWRDQAYKSAQSCVPDALLSRAYGLHDLTSQPRYAFYVMRGFFTGRQLTFAFASGQPATFSVYDMLRLFALIVLGMWGIMFKQFPLFHRLVRRYFGAHTFYQESLRRKEVASLAVHGVITNLYGLAFALVSFFLWVTFASYGKAVRLLCPLGGPLREAWAVLLESSWYVFWIAWLIFLLGVGGIVGYVLLISRGKLRFRQALPLVIFPLWGMLFWLLVVALVSSLPPERQYMWLPWIVWGIAGTGVWAGIRMGLDLAGVLHLPVGRSLLWLPGVGWGLVLIIGLLLYGYYAPEVRFIFYILMNG